MNTSTIATVFPDLRDVPTDLEFDLVFLIDSLYYFPQPTAALRVLAGLVGMGGCIVIRITNRTRLLDFLVRIGMSARISRALFGDEIVAFSHRGMKKKLLEPALGGLYYTEGSEKKRVFMSWARYDEPLG